MRSHQSVVSRLAKLQKGRGLRLCTIMALHNNGYTGRKRSPPALLSQEPVAKQALTSPVLPAMSPPTKEEMLAAARKAAAERRNTLHGCTGAQRFAKVDGQHGLPPLEALAYQEEQIAKGSNLAALEAQRRPQRRAALVISKAPAALLLPELPPTPQTRSGQQAGLPAPVPFIHCLQVEVDERGAKTPEALHLQKPHEATMEQAIVGVARSKFAIPPMDPGRIAVIARPRTDVRARQRSAGLIRVVDRCRLAGAKEHAPLLIEHMASNDIGAGNFGMQFAKAYRTCLYLEQQFHGKGKKLGYETHDIAVEDAVTIDVGWSTMAGSAKWVMEGAQANFDPSTRPLGHCSPCFHCSLRSHSFC